MFLGDRHTLSEAGDLLGHSQLQAAASCYGVNSIRAALCSFLCLSANLGRVRSAFLVWALQLGNHLASTGKRSVCLQLPHWALPGSLLLCFQDSPPLDSSESHGQNPSVRCPAGFIAHTVSVTFYPDRAMCVNDAPVPGTG